MKNLKSNTMKNKLTIFIIAIILLPLTGMAQSDIFEKYSDNANVTYVNIKPKMFKMIAKIGIDTDDVEAQSYMDMVNSVTSFKTIVTGNKVITGDILKWVKSKSNALEELMVVKNEGSEVKFYVKEGKDEDHVKELLIFVSGIENIVKDGIEIQGEKREIETVVVSLTGNIDLNQISKLTDKMNIPGGKNLDKKH